MPADTGVPQYIYPRATAGKRFLNYLIDTIVAYGILIGVSFAVYFFATYMPALETFWDGLGGSLTAYGLMLGYFFVMEATIGRSLGKIITNTLVLDAHDRKASWQKCLGRTFSRLIPFEAFTFLGANASGWHDTIPGTKVVDTRKPPNIIAHATTPMTPLQRP